MKIIPIVRIPLLLVPVLFIAYWLCKAVIAVVKYLFIFLLWSLDKIWLGIKKTLPYVKRGIVMFVDKCIKNQNSSIA